MENTNNYIPADHLARIMDHLHGEDRLICQLLIDTGFRCDDLLHVRVWQFRSGTISLVESKTGNRRTVNIDPIDMPGKHAFQYAFGGRRGRHGDRRKVHRTTIWRHFEFAVSQAGLDGRGYTIHSLRKVYAVNLFKRCGDVQIVQRAMGHKYIGTTAIYLIGALKSV